MRRPLAIALLAATLFTGWPATVRSDADGSPDYDIPNGHFFTQTNGNPAGGSSRGYSITDEDGVPFWSAFLELGGVERLGYPISRRFLWHGFVSQATQKAVLQWSPDAGMVQLVNTIDHLAGTGLEDRLRGQWLTPEPSPEGIIAADAAGTLRWLASQPAPANAFHSYYAGAADPMRLYGLPTSPPRDLGDLIALRFQKTVLQLWKVDGPGVAQGTVTSLNVGEIVKASGIVPPDALELAEAPDEDVRAEGLRMATSRGAGSPVRGIATWYGHDFHGATMRNGDRFDMYDPTITAANAFPLGTWLRVTNVESGDSVEVLVVDTGAFVYPIVVDLSWAAFRKLDDPNRGVIRVIVQPLRRS